MQSCLERICIGCVDKRGGQQSRKFMHKQEEEVPGDRQLGRSVDNSGNSYLEGSSGSVYTQEWKQPFVVLPSGFN